MTPPARSRRWLWRALVSALAGSGITVAGLGPIAGGALAAEGTGGGEGTVTTTTTTEETTTTTTSEPTTPETTTTSTPPPATSSVPSSTPTTTPAPPATTTTPAETTSAQTELPAPAKPTAKGPAVVLQRKQKTSPSKNTSTTTTATTAPGTPTTAAAPGANNVALAPQVIAAQEEALAAELAGSAASTQALSFYRIPLFLLPIYQAAAVQYGVPWQILAAINEIETNYGTDQSVSTAGAVGWMQFMPATWIQYGVDALNAGYADPYNPVDAIFAAARYLRAAGAATDLHAAILAYNHSEEYVNSVLLRAKLISSYPKGVIATLTGLTDGRLPVSGKKVAWGALSSVANPSSATAGATAAKTPAKTSDAAASAPAATPGATPAPTPTAAAATSRKSLKHAPPLQLVDLLSAPNAKVVAAQDGRIVRLGSSHKLGKYVILRDVYGDVFTYSGLGSIASHYAKPKTHTTPASSTPALPAVSSSEPKPKLPATAGAHPPVTLKVKKPAAKRAKTGAGSVSVATEGGEPAPASTGKVRLFAHPGNPDALVSAASKRKRAARSTRVGKMLPLRAGAIVTQGTVLGRVRTPHNARDGHLRFAIAPGGDQATIDPRPILQNWARRCTRRARRGRPTCSVRRPAASS
jgi:soluble lytic murein transglycosylase-like protein